MLLGSKYNQHQNNNYHSLFLSIKTINEIILIKKELFILNNLLMLYRNIENNIGPNVVINIQIWI